jgi:hypothetical protein
MSDVTRILSPIESGDSRAAEQLLQLRNWLRRNRPDAAGHGPGPHEAYLRLVGVCHSGYRASCLEQMIGGEGRLARRR